jgi:hypothetical protein
MIPSARFFIVVSAIIPTVNGLFCTFIIWLKSGSICRLLSTNLLLDKTEPSQTIVEGLLQKSCYRYAWSQISASFGLFIVYAVIAANRRGNVLDIFMGIAYTVPFFFMFGIIDVFHHSVTFAVALLAENLNTTLRNQSYESKDEVLIEIKFLPLYK